MGYSHATVAHHWANKTGKCSNGHHVWYSGDTIYSYNTHFPMARHVGNDTVLFTTQGYSQSTSKHLSHTRSACSHLNVIEVDNVEARGFAAHRENLDKILAEIEETAGKIARARTYKEFYRDDVEKLIEMAYRYAAFAKLPLRKTDKAILETSREDFEKLDAAFKALNKVQRERYMERTLAARKRQAERERIEAERAKEQLAEWKAGEREHAPYHHSLNSTCLRVKGDTVETSKGVKISASEAEKLWTVIQACRERGKEFRPNGERHAVTDNNGHPWQIDHISALGVVRAGCHLIPYEESLDTAKALGLAA